MGSLFSDMEVDISPDREVDFMKIIESSIIGKKSPEACEDGMVVTDDFIAVIDGSTSKTPKHLNPDMKNGRYAMMLISEYIREELKADAFTSCSASHQVRGYGKTSVIICDTTFVYHEGFLKTP